MEKPTISMIAAMDLNNTIAIDGRLPWGKLMGDKRWYLSKIAGHTIVMGSTTFAQIPDHSRQGNKIVVVSRSSREELGLPEDVELINNVEKLSEIAPMDGTDEIFVTGGGEVFRMFIDRADKLYLTIVQHGFAETGKVTKFPEVDPRLWQDQEAEGWESTEVSAENPYPFEVKVFVRKAQA